MMRKKMISLAKWLRSSLLALLPALAVTTVGAADDAAPQKQRFEIAGAKAFVLEPPQSSRIEGPMPWVWYAPTLSRLPGREEQWMFQRFHARGIAIAGVDVGESFGSPKGRAVYQALYKHLTGQRGYSKKPVLLARSRGGLMLYNWAVEHPKSVGGIAGIYPVCNITSYPGLARAAPAYEMTAEQLKVRLKDHNPIDRLGPLAKAKVPIFHLQGDSDRVVPHEKNSGILAERYAAAGGPVQVQLIEGQGHNLWQGWFQSAPLTDFVIARALPAP